MSEFAIIINGKPTDRALWADILDDEDFRALGGPGSGNFGHAGRPGKVGGSAPGHVGGSASGDLTQSSFTTSTANTTELVRDAAVASLAAKVKIDPNDLAALIDAEKANDLTMQQWVIGKTPDELLKGYLQGVLGTWAGGSGGPAVSQMARAVVAERLGGQNYSEPPNSEGTIAFMRENPGVKRALDAIGLAMYDNTQEWLKERGITEIPLVRAGAPGYDRLHTSWSLHHGGVRYETGRPLVSELVPAKYIWSVPSTGFGTLAESEVVVLPRPIRVLGGPGSGNFGHAGRPGQVGGSAPDEGYVDDGGSSWSPMSNTVLKEMLALHKERSPSVQTLLKELKRRAKKGDARAQQVHDETVARFRAAKAPTVSKVSFNKVNKRAATWARKHAAELVTDITETSRKQIKKAIAKLLEGENYNTVVGLIEKAVGDDDRAMLIAHHETMTAVSAGQREVWLEAQEEGVLPDNTKRVWIITPINPCPDCEALDGAVANIDGLYPDGSIGPPRHPRCRCTEGLI